MKLGYSKCVIAVLLLFCPLYTQANCKCEQITSYVNGRRVCSCKPGYVVNSNHHEKCQDINECNAPAGNPCRQICTNTVGSYSCSCSPGYTVNDTNPHMCVDIDECNGLARNPCQLSPVSDAGLADIDECSGTSYPCDDVCTNTIGGYTCSCQQPGYITDKTNRTKCTANYIPCNTAASENTGIITSPNYPDYYPPRTECFWSIPLKPQMVTIISFIDFKLETSQDCIYDYLKIYNGTTISDPLLYKLCGQYSLDPISSPYNLYLVFHSDDYDSFKGFELIYTYESIDSS